MRAYTIILVLATLIASTIAEGGHQQPALQQGKKQPTLIELPPQYETLPGKTQVLAPIQGQAQPLKVLPTVDEGYQKDITLPAITQVHQTTKKQRVTEKSTHTKIQPVLVPQPMKQAHVSHRRVIQPIIKQEVIQPVIEKQPIIKEQVVKQPVLKPSLTETHQAKAPEVHQKVSHAQPIVNQPQKHTLPAFHQQVQTVQNQPITQPMTVTESKSHAPQQQAQQSNHNKQ